MPSPSRRGIRSFDIDRFPMEKRILFAFLLSLAVLYGSRLLLPTKPASPQPAAQSAEKAPQSTAPTAPATTASPGENNATPPPTGEVRATEATDVVVETPLYIATISNHGAV